MYVCMHCLFYRSDILVVSNEPSLHTWLFKNKVFTKLKLIFELLSNTISINFYYTFSPVSSSKISSWPLPSIHSSNSFWKTDWRDSAERAILLWRARSAIIYTKILMRFVRAWVVVVVARIRIRTPTSSSSRRIRILQQSLNCQRMCFILWWTPAIISCTISVLPHC